MKTIIITVESEKSSKEISNLLKKRKDVMSILIESDGGYNWIHPSHPASPEQISELISEAEKTPLIAAEDAAPYIRRSFNQWKKKRKSR